MNVILTVDFGSTFTKVTAVCAQKKAVIGTAKAFTTIQTDIHDGLHNALNELFKQTGKINFDRQYAASSAGGGLKMVAVGLVPSLTAKAAQMAACSAGAKVVKTFAYELSQTEQQEIYDINPDLILLSGGTDGGNKTAILFNANKLAEIDRDFSVIVAGNKSVAQTAVDELKKHHKNAVLCENVMPEFNKLNIQSAKTAISNLFMEKIIHAKGISEASRMMSAPIIPTPLAVFEGAELLATQMGSLLAVDVGGATTDVYSMADGSPTMPHIMLKGLPEPYAKRSVEGDLGMRYSMDALVHFINENNPNIDDEAFKKHIKHCKNNPSFVPALNSIESDFDSEMCATAVGIAVRRHCGKLESAYSPHGKTFYQTGKDLSNVKYVIGIGGSIIYSENPAEILSQSIAAGKDSETGNDSEFLQPQSPKFLLDKNYIFSCAGLLSRVDKLLALQLMENNITEV